MKHSLLFDNFKFDRAPWIKSWRLRVAFTMFFGGAFFASAWSQSTTITTGPFPPYTGTNSLGAGGQIGFVIDNQNGYGILLTGIGNYATTADNNSVWRLFYTATELSGSTTNCESGAWSLIATSSATTVTGSAITALNFTNLSFEIPANTQYRFALENQGPGSVRYTGTGTACPNLSPELNTFLSNGVALKNGCAQISGQNIGWSGTGSGLNSNSPRYFTGFITFEPATLPSPDDCGVSAIVSPEYYCANQSTPLLVEVSNFGTNPLDSCMVVWNVNGTIDSAWFSLDLDSIGGSGSTDTILFLDSLSISGALTIDAYTKWPNTMPDTVNLNDTTNLSIASPSLSGTYVIGSSGGADYPTFTAAAAALNTLGVCAEVIFEVESATYAEQFVLNEIQGANSQNTITFRSQAQDSTAVTLSFAGTATQNSIVKLNGADWVRFEHMTLQNTSTTYDAGFELLASADSNIISNCRLIGSVSGTTAATASLVYSSGSDDKGNTFRNNLFEGSGYGVYLYGTGTTSLEPGTVLENNRFINQYYQGMRLYYQDAPKVHGNLVMSNSAYGTGYGIYMAYCDNGTEVSANHVTRDPNSANTWPYYGIYITTSDGTGLNNTIRFFNNRVVIGADYGSGSTATFYGMYLTSTNAVRLANNSVTILSGGGTSRAMYQTACDINFHHNNLYTNYGTGNAAYYASGISIDIDHNNYYAPDGFEIYYVSSNYDVNTFATATGFDLNGHNYNPDFSDMFQAFVCNDSLDGVGTPISYIATDYSGFPRNATNPDPGAVEFIGVNNFSLGADDTICGNTHLFEVTGPTSTIGWSVNGTPSGGNSVTLNNTSAQPQVYNVVLVFTSATGCGSASDAAVVTLVSSAGLDSAGHLCAGATATLAPGGGANATYLWAPDNQTSSTILVDGPGTYSVTKNELGCVSSASTTITQSVAVNIPDIEPCKDELPVSLDATIPDGVNYAWNGGTNVNSAINTFNDEGSYAVTTTDSYGCVSSDGFIIDIIDVPTAVITTTHYSNIFLFSSIGSLNTGSNATYIWNFGDGDTSHAANPSHPYPWTGIGSAVTYTVSLTVINDCGSHTTTVNVTPDPLGVEAPDNSDLFTVFPNPATDVLFVRLQKAANVQVELIDLRGRLVSKHNEVTSTVEMNTSAVAPGSYLLRVTTEGKTSYANVVID